MLLLGYDITYFWNWLVHPIMVQCLGVVVRIPRWNFDVAGIRLMSLNHGNQPLTQEDDRMVFRCQHVSCTLQTEPARSLKYYDAQFFLYFRLRYAKNQTKVRKGT